MPSRPFLLFFLLRFPLGTCLWLDLLGLKRASCASRASFLSASVILFGAGDFGAGRNLSLVVSAASLHCTLTVVVFFVPCLLSQSCFQRVRLLAISASCSKDSVGGASARRLAVSPFSYWTLTACFTSLSSPMRRMWPSHTNFLLRIASKTLKVLLRGLASVCADLPVILEIKRAFAPFIAADASRVRRQASLP